LSIHLYLKNNDVDISSELQLKVIIFDDKDIYQRCKNIIIINRPFLKVWVIKKPNRFGSASLGYHRLAPGSSFSVKLRISTA
jgi:hypothetical protein